MPELGEQMYCHQQICIPPTFPYVLRQFAKAAIRTQPNDLLKWATTYFRCLSLNIPPPVKPRLEYPIPRDHQGLTPGWLRALLNQMPHIKTIEFKILWDRWIGACLKHFNLIQILCLGGFDDKDAIPWLRFLALCAGHLTDNLTQTMILICEILTEEPEGGSAMIPVETFVDLYQFLARIDASIPQTLRNYYFLDKFLELYQEKIAKDSGVVETEPEPEELSLTTTSSGSALKSEKEARKDTGGSVISCPSVTSQDPDNFMKLLMKIQQEGEEYEGEDQPFDIPQIREEPQKIPGEEVIETKEYDEDILEAGPSKEELDEKPKEEEAPVYEEFSQQLEADARAEGEAPEEDAASMDTKLSLEKEDEEAALEELKRREEEEREQKFLLEDLERLKAVHHTIMCAEDDDELDRLKASMLEPVSLTESQMAAVEHFDEPIEEKSTESSMVSMKSDVSSESEPPVQEVVEEQPYEDVQVDAIPGIGGRVPEDIIVHACQYMTEISKWQHGMVMPRNIRHFECPPLEIYQPN